MFKSFLKKTAKISALTVFAAVAFFSGPTVTNAAPLTLAQLMTDLATATSPAEALVAATSTDTAALTSAKNTLDAKISGATVQAQLDLSTETDLDTNLGNQLRTAREANPGTTNETKREYYRKISEILIAQTQCQLRIISIRSSMLTISLAQLTSAQLERLIAGTDSAALQVANTRVNLATTAVSMAEGDLKTITTKIQTTASDARVAALAAQQFAAADVNDKQTAVDLAQANLDALLRDPNADPITIFNARGALSQAQQRLTNSSNLLLTGAIATNVATAQDLYTTAGNVSVATSLAVAAAEDRLKAEAAMASSSAIAAGNAATVAGITGSGSPSGGFDFGAFVARGAAPCAAVAGAQWLGAQLGGTTALSVAAPQIPLNVPVLDLNSVYHGGTNEYNAPQKSLSDCLIYTMGQLMIENMTADIIDWIRGGFDGKPRFATDLNSLLDGAEDIEGGDLVRELRGLATCNFGVNFIDDLGLQNSSRKTHRNMFKDKVYCPFGDGNLNYTASQFYSDFTKGGWKAYEAMTGDSGNPFGLKVLTSTELLERQKNATETKKQRLNWASGFSDEIDPDSCKYPQGLKESDDAGSALDPNDPKYISPQTVRAHQTQYCDTVTPGGMIQSRLQKATNTDLDRLGVADSLNKIINQLITTLATNAAKSAFKNL